MFFPKKKKSAPAPVPAPSDQRAQYRKRPSKAQRLEATLDIPGWPSLTVELVDLTMRGVGLRVPFASDRNLKIGDIVELKIGAMMRDEIATPARVVNSGPDGESHVRYGFEFLNIGNLYSQLDGFYSRHFNRRRNTRVLPALDRKIQAALTWSGEELHVQVFDVSESGIGLVLTRDSAARVLDVKRFGVRFKLPGREEELAGPVSVRHRTPVHQHTLLGLTYDLETPVGFVRHLAAIRAFVEQRASEMALWEKR
jgi:c-di-GMP-binding flagellar brake protein YcgR